ncbi:hypothetical protein MMC20_005354 [Loxospora ochrophaea]|nr:hypothetical protein [Loxospora ochrophaea]
MLCSSRSLLALAIAISLVESYPASSNIVQTSQIDDPDFGPIPGESAYYSDYDGTAPPFPANDSSPILPTANGTKKPDDLLFQNLLAAEWAIYSFYQQGIEAFDADFFTVAGFPNNTYDRLVEIRNNEAGHLRIFQDQISNSSVKPGPCKYDFGYPPTAEAYLAFGTGLELTSMAFLTGLILQAQSNASKSALVAIAATESRHETWNLIDIWHTSPFAGPSDTVFPFGNQVLDVTNEFIVPGSCPPENPVYPYPRQNLPQLNISPSTSNLLPGSNITFVYTNATHVPTFETGKDYYMVFFHGLDVVSVPYDPKTNTTTIPQNFDKKGFMFAVIADAIGAPTEESVLAGPMAIMEQPISLNQYF